MAADLPTLLPNAATPMLAPFTAAARAVRRSPPRRARVRDRRALVRSWRALDVKDVELLVLRYEGAILHRQVPRSKLGIAGPADASRRSVSSAAAAADP